MENSLQNGLIVTVIGIAIVFLGLTVLIGLIKIMTLATNRMGAKKEAPKAPVAPAPVVTAAPAEEEAPEEDDAAVVAAIMAAVSCVMGGRSGFIVRHIRRV